MNDKVSTTPSTESDNPILTETQIQYIIAAALVACIICVCIIFIYCYRKNRAKELEEEYHVSMFGVQTFKYKKEVPKDIANIANEQPQSKSPSPASPPEIKTNPEPPTSTNPITNPSKPEEEQEAKSPSSSSPPQPLPNLTNRANTNSNARSYRSRDKSNTIDFAVQGRNRSNTVPVQVYHPNSNIPPPPALPNEEITNKKPNVVELLEIITKGSPEIHHQRRMSTPHSVYPFALPQGHRHYSVSHQPANSNPKAEPYLDAVGVIPKHNQVSYHRHSKTLQFTPYHISQIKASSQNNMNQRYNQYQQQYRQQYQHHGHRGHQNNTYFIGAGYGQNHNQNQNFHALSQQQKEQYRQRAMSTPTMEFRQGHANYAQAVPMQQPQQNVHQAAQSVGSKGFVLSVLANDKEVIDERHDDDGDGGDEDGKEDYSDSDSHHTHTREYSEHSLKKHTLHGQDTMRVIHHYVAHDVKNDLKGKKYDDGQVTPLPKADKDKKVRFAD